MTAILQLAELYDSGNAAFQKLKRPRTRAEAARLVWRLRAWARELRAAAAAYSAPLAASLRIVDPGPDEIQRCDGAMLLPGKNGRPSEAQRCTLVYTAGALHRLAPHLAAVTPRASNFKAAIPGAFADAAARDPLKFEHGELRRLARQIAAAVGCNESTAEQYIRPLYNAKAGKRGKSRLG